MKITFVGLNYAPDLVGIAPYNVRLCDYFVERGHNVLVITGFPYYPSWKKNKADRWTFYRKGRGRKRFLIRSYVYVPSKVTVFRRILHELSFTLAAMVPAIFTRKPDLIYVVSPPLSLGIFGIIVSRLRRVPFVLQVNDLVPDTAVVLHFLHNRFIIKVLYMLEKMVYTNATLISVVSQSMRDNLVAKGVPEDKITVRYDFVDVKKLQPAAGNNPFRAELGLAGKFIILHSGNMGQKMGLEIILEAAKKCMGNPRYADFQFLLVGDGVSRPYLLEKAEEYKLNNVTFLPLQPVQRLPQMISAADIALVVLREGVKDICFPGKLLTYMACATPVIASVDEESETAIQLKKVQGGLITRPGSADELLKAIVKLKTDARLRRKLGENGRRGISRYFEKYTVLDTFHDRLMKAVKGE